MLARINEERLSTNSSWKANGSLLLDRSGHLGRTQKLDDICSQAQRVILPAKTTILYVGILIRDYGSGCGMVLWASYNFRKVGLHWTAG